MTHQEPTPTPSPPPPRLPLRQHETEATERSVYVDKALLEYRKGAKVFFPDDDEGWTLAESTIDAELKGLIFSAMFTIIKNGEVRVLQKHVKDLVEADLPLLRKPGDEVSDSTTLLNSVNPGAPMNNATFTESHIAKARKSISLTKNASPVLWNFSSMESNYESRVISSPGFVDHVLDAAISKVTIPQTLTGPKETRPEAKDILYPAHIVCHLCNLAIENDLVVEMNSLAQGAIAEMHRLADLKERAAFFFWLSNLIEFFRLLESVRLREEAKPFNGAITKIVTRVVLTTRSILEDSLLPTLFSSLCEHAASLAEPALFDCLKLGTGWLGASRSNGTGRLKLNHYLSNLGGLMQACKLPLDLWERIMLRLLKTVGDTSMNAIWKLKGTLTPAIASTIDENLETVIGWFVVIGMEDARREVMVLKDTLDAITHRKECAADVNSLLSSLAVMNAKQILHVLTVCCDPKVMAETVKDEFWSCLNEHANTISMHSIDLNDHSQVTTSNDHSQVTTSDCESLTLVPKNNCSHFVPATILLHEHILRLF